ncbi:DUF4920 domain-containing protein [Flavobacterium sp.]|uniref:DUF4920 domain-containing protein n=1 Tax=Flavobacterium sp. TaxID=239 RepID=UPI003751AE4E
MKKLNSISLLIVLFLSFSATSQVVAKKAKKSKVESVAINTNDYALFGEKFVASKVLTNKEMLKKYKTLKKGDSVAVKFKSTIKEVCKKKGCWMQMDLSDDNQSFVRFKDYGFFVPLNADNSEAIVNGIAFIDVVTVDELKHYAKDAGKSQAEINKITKPEITYAFKATGVLIKK